ncbi:CopG family ribbon-helix-helix protein [Luteimonas suaedae]|uniref:CopG family ribbon-helix-helix protein n=1 Tax=Luteimonas suaedae TaxID=2605430 RepID=UPI0011EE8415|nr:ribbon-helix-helix protein, CopG family [Luteimonas suaedae]
MSTTTIRLPEDLKARIARAAKEAGTTSHNFILEAIAEKAELAEQRAGFHDEAERRYARIVETGETIDWDEYRAYMMGRVRGESVKRPVARKLAK